MNNIGIVLQDIINERKQQTEKWGDQHHYLGDWMAILGEEFGEACKEAVESTFGPKPEESLAKLRTELIHTAAVAVQIIEKIDEASNEPPA